MRAKTFCHNNIIKIYKNLLLKNFKVKFYFLKLHCPAYNNFLLFSIILIVSSVKNNQIVHFVRVDIKFFISAHFGSVAVSFSFPFLNLSDGKLK